MRGSGKISCHLSDFIFLFFIFLVAFTLHSPGVFFLHVQSCSTFESLRSQKVDFFFLLSSFFTCFPQRDLSAQLAEAEAYETHHSACIYLPAWKEKGARK